MRIVLVTLASFSLGTFRMCGSDEPPPVSATASTAVVATAPSGSATVEVAPTHGGTVTRAGVHPIEVVPHASGEVYAYPQGELGRPADVEMTVAVPVEGGRTRPVQMRWDRRERRYEGRVRGVAIVPGPVELDIVIGEEHLHTEVVVVAIAPAIHVDVHVADVHVHHHGKHHKHRKHHKHHW